MLVHDQSFLPFMTHVQFKLFMLFTRHLLCFSSILLLLIKFIYHHCLSHFVITLHTKIYQILYKSQQILFTYFLTTHLVTFKLVCMYKLP